MATHIDIDMGEFKSFFDRLESAAKGDFRKEFEVFLDALGNEFLRLVQDEIIRRKVMDSRLLLASFEKGADDNVWTIEDSGCVLEVGTNVQYAKYVEYGHKQQPGRFIPGHWDGERFVYEPGAKEGMVLKANWVDGKHYFDGAIHIMEKIYPEILERKLQEWLESYFGG